MRHARSLVIGFLVLASLTGCAVTRQREFGNGGRRDRTDVELRIPVVSWESEARNNNWTPPNAPPTVVTTAPPMAVATAVPMAMAKPCQARCGHGNHGGHGGHGHSLKRHAPNIQGAHATNAPMANASPETLAFLEQLVILVGDNARSSLAIRAAIIQHHAGQMTKEHLMAVVDGLAADSVETKAEVVVLKEKATDPALDSIDQDEAKIRATALEGRAATYDETVERLTAQIMGTAGPS